MPMALYAILALDGGLVRLMVDVDIPSRTITAVELHNDSAFPVFATLDRPVGDTITRTVAAGGSPRITLTRPIPLSVALDLLEGQLMLSYSA